MKQCILLTFILAFSTLSYSQSRIIDMEIILNSPVEGGEYYVGEPLPTSIWIKNNGPDDLIIGDSIFIMLTDPILGTSEVKLSILWHPIPSQESASFIEHSHTITADMLDLNTYCAQLVDDPSTQIKTSDGSQIFVSYIDPLAGNNGRCRNISIKDGGTNTIVNKTTNSKIELHPNPATNQVLLTLTDNESRSGANVLIMDLSGRQHYSRSYKIEDLIGTQQILLDTKQLMAGTYLIQVRSPQGIRIGKLFVTN